MSWSPWSLGAFCRAIFVDEAGESGAEIVDVAECSGCCLEAGGTNIPDCSAFGPCCVATESWASRVLLTSDRRGLPRARRGKFRA